MITIYNYFDKKDAELFALLILFFNFAIG